MAPDYISFNPGEIELDVKPIGHHNAEARDSHGVAFRRRRTRAALQSIVLLVLISVLAKISLFWLGYDVSVAIIRLESAQHVGWHGDSGNIPGSGSGKQDKDDAALTTKAPKRNAWAGLSPEDNAAVWNWLHDPAQGLNLTLPDHAKINDNYVFWIDALPPNKSTVLSFLDGDGPIPSTYARVILYEGGKAKPVVQEYMVGPLPVEIAVANKTTRIEKLDYIYNGGMGGTVPFNARAPDLPTRQALDVLVAPIMADVADITSSLFGGAQYFGMQDNRSTVLVNSATPTSLDGSSAHLHAVFHFPGPAAYLLPIDFYVLMDWSGTDTRYWSVKGFVTKGRFFSGVNSLREAFIAGEIVPDVHQRRDFDWALPKYQPELGERPLEDREAPQSSENGGKRYRLDAAEKYVEYMGWSLYMTHSRTQGVLFYDIRFRGERILYELSMQEAASQYGGFQPKAASTVYHDVALNLGTTLFPLVAGFDCPSGSTFWNVSFHETNRTVVHPSAICIFEHDPGYPLSRHRAGNFVRRVVPPEDGSDNDNGWGFESLGVVKNAELNIRFIATVGNYDYIFNYAFGLDGSLTVTVRASGYLMSSPYYPEQRGRFGPRIQQGTQGSIHDHVLTFKADFDVLDAANRLEKTQLQAVPQTQPWFPELGTFEQLQLSASTVVQEQPLDWTSNHDTMYTVVHANATNAWGESRGYRIIPGRSNIRLTTQRSPWSRDNMAFAKSHLAVTRQHDTEQFANSVHNYNLPWKPQQDFAKFFNNESINGEDLVVWFNLGMHHFTRAEDVPVTLFSEAVSSITFAPQNFFDRAQDGDLKNRRWIVPDGATGRLSVEDYGVLKCSYPGEPVGKIYTQ